MSKSTTLNQTKQYTRRPATNNPLWQQPFHTPLEAKALGTPASPPHAMPVTIAINEAHATISRDRSKLMTPGALPHPSFRCETCGCTWPAEFMRMIPHPTDFFKDDIMSCKVCVSEM